MFCIQEPNKLYSIVAVICSFIVKDIESQTSFRTINCQIQCYIYRHIFTTGTTRSIYNQYKVIPALYLSFTKQKGCQVCNSYVRSSNYALLAIAQLPTNELTSIHTLSLPPLLLQLLMSIPLYFLSNSNRQ